MTTPNDERGIWLTADYTFASVFSYRMPMSSITAAQALPTPGPATVRLALLRTGFELFGEDATREHIFPIVRAMAVRIQPPERIAIGQQRLRGYKATKKHETITIKESPILRDMAHCAGSLRIGINVPSADEPLFRELFTGIGYWGQASGLAWCTDIGQETLAVTSCIAPLQSISRTQQIRGLFTGLATEFRQAAVAWQAVVPALHERQSCALHPNVYVWPLQVIEQRSTGIVLERCSIERMPHQDEKKTKGWHNANQ
jgi:hypothetical protein